MGKNKENERQKKEEKSNPRIPSKIVNPIESHKPTSNEKEKTQQQIDNISAIRETIIFKEDEFASKNFRVQRNLMIVAIATLMGFVIFSIIQHLDSINNLRIAKRSFDSTNIATQKSLALAESSNALTRRSLYIADNSLQETRISNRLAKDNFVLENRAFIVFQNTKRPFFAISDSGVVLSFNIKNVGKTPAQGVIHYPFICLDDDSIENVIIDGEKFLNRHKADAGFVIGESDTITIIGNLYKEDRAEAQALFTYLTKNKPFINIGCIIIYRDIFSESHKTYFITKSKIGSNEIMVNRKWNKIE